MKNWSWKAVLGGIAICLLGQQILGALLILPWTFFLSILWHVPHQQITASFPESTDRYVISLVAAIVSFGFGGYATAAWAPKRKVFHCFLVVVLFVAIRSLLPTNHASPFWFHISGRFAYLLPMLSGWWWVKTHGVETKIDSSNDSISGSPPIASPF